MFSKIEKANNVITLDTGYRYEGVDPNNYIMFNNELWRIIGVFDESSHGQTGKNLVKIIRNSSIGGYYWDSSYNKWPSSKLYHLLNEQYYNWDIYKNNVDNYCKGAANCDYNVTGIQDEYRNMVNNVTWYLGGLGKENYNTRMAINIYSYERDANAIYTGRSASTSGYVGLMYLSDSLLSVLSSDCERTSLSYSTSNCEGKSWLNIGCAEWTITPYSNASNNAYIAFFGSLPVYGGYVVRPTLYLSSSVYKVSGTGTITDPYIIGM